MSHPTLPELTACVARKDEDAVLHLLLRVWAQERPAAVARAIEALSPRFLFRRPPLVALQPWLLTARSKDSLLVASLLAPPWAAEGRRILRKKFEALADFPPDPRIAAFARDVLHQRVRARRPSGLEIDDLMARVAERHGGTPQSPDDPEHEQLADMALSLPPSLEQELLAAVQTSPGDDGPRLVYTDWLLSMGSPLAPFFARKRPTELPAPLRAWWHRRLFGDGGPANVEYRHGFPCKVDLGWGVPPTLAAGWATVEELEVHQPDLQWLEDLRGLPHLSTLTVKPWPGSSPAQLQPPAGLPIQTLALPWSLWRPIPLGEALRWPRLHTLRFLEADQTTLLDEVHLGSICLRPLAVELHLTLPDSPRVGLVWKITRTAAPGVRQVRFGTVAGPLLSIERQGVGPLDVVRVSRWGVHNADAVSLLLLSIPPSEVSRIEVEVGWSGAVEPLRRALARFPLVEIRGSAG